MKSLTWQTLKIFWQHSKQYSWYIFFICLFMVLVMVSDIAQPFFYKFLLNYVATGDFSSIDYPIRMVFYISASAITYNIGWRSVIAFTNVFQGKTKRDLYKTCYNYILDHSTDFFSNNFVGGLVAKLGRFDRAFETVADEFIFGIGRTIILLLFIFVTLAFQIPLAAYILGIWVSVYLVCTWSLSRFRFKYDLSTAEQDTKVSGHVADTLTNNSAIKVFAAEKTEKFTFSGIIHEQYVRRRKAWDISNYVDIFQGGMMIILEFVLMYAAVHLWRQGKITVGDFVLLQSFMLSVFHHLWEIGRNMRKLYQSIADANEMTTILTTSHEVKDLPNADKMFVKNGEINFSNISFKYKDNPEIFDKFNLTISAGERVALVGPSGGGKSTIVKLLFRFYDITNGQITIDNQDISKVTQVSLRQNMSLVPQDPILFHRSIFENIRYAKQDATLDEVVEAAKAAHCHEFIEKLPNKYDTLVGERGVKLSGGERQRVAIARAILKNAPILVLDEATSSLDSESESLIQDALKTLMKGKTTIVIAHRLSTIMAVDRIVVIEDGKITEQGKHEELLKAQEGKYQKLWHIQSGSYA